MTFDMAQDIILSKLNTEKVLQIAQNTGLRYIDPMNLSEKTAKKYASLMKKYPVKVYCYIAQCSMLRSQEAIQAQVRESLHTAQILGAKLLMLVPVNVAADRGKAKKMGRKRVIEAMVTGFRTAVKTADETNIRICLETTPHDFSCCSGTEDCEQILKAVPGLGLVFDTANMMVHGDNPLSCYERLKGYIIYAHLKDIRITGKNILDKLIGGEYLPDGSHMQGVIPGEGCVPLKEIVVRMEADGYTGSYAIEYRRPSGLAVGVEGHSAQVRKALNFLEQMTAVERQK